MPELPEVEITARRIGAALAGARVESVHALGVNVLKTFDPPLSVLEGATFSQARRRGKLVQLVFSDDHVLLIHLMSAGRLRLYDHSGSRRDRNLRLTVQFTDGRELRLREFGTKQRAWVKLLPKSQLAADEVLSKLGPDAWPKPSLEGITTSSRPLHALLRDQYVIAGIGRAWTDEILHQAKLGPFKKGSDLDQSERERLASAIGGELGRGIEFYEETVSFPIPDKLPKPLRIHDHNGQPCPRCGNTLEAVFYSEHVLCYCPTCQTDGRLLKDRRLSRLLK